VAAEVGAGSDVDVAARERGEFGDTQSALDGDEEQCVVSAADPFAAVGAGEQGVDLVVGEERDELSVGALAGMASTRWISAACSGWRRAA
jgi:hypothetical protein